VIDGISTAELASSEVAITLLMPAARAWLEVAAAFGDDGPLVGVTPTSFTTFVPGPIASGATRYRALEALQCDAADAAVRERFGDEIRIGRRGGRPETPLLEQKYAQTRDWPWLVPATTSEHWRQAGPAALINAAAATRGRRRAPSLLVYEYNPTNAFAEQYSARPEPRMRLARCRTPRADLTQVVTRGDRLIVPPRVAPSSGHSANGHDLTVARSMQEHDDAFRERFRLGGIDLWPLIRRRLLEVVSAYEPLATAAPRWRARLRRERVKAVVVPFDSPPEARLLVLVARGEGIPTFMVNDGFKADDHSMDGMTVDHVLAWSDALAENYYSRRPGSPALVTGNPKADAQRAIRPRRPRSPRLERVLVGSFTFSPVDLNCRRSDSEVFLTGVLAGIRDSRLARGARVRLKLHPADRPDYYRSIFAALPEVPVDIITQGDVIDEFDSSDLYITTYSTSLLEAVARELPVIYYQVNQQQLHPPFRNDPFLTARTAESPAELSALLDDPALREPPSPETRDAWVERYLGAADGRSTERIERAILSELRNRSSASS
jgi:hypothetical protein